MSPYNKLWIKSAFAKVPTIDESRGQDDPICYVKLFSPLNGWRWYIIGYDPDTGLAYGLVQGHETELGDFALREVNPGDWQGEDMQSQNDNFRGRYRIPPFERDGWFKPTVLSKVQAYLSTAFEL